jgi:hypothetical protein
VAIAITTDFVAQAFERDHLLFEISQWRKDAFELKIGTYLIGPKLRWHRSVRREQKNQALHFCRIPRLGSE